jgi:hypothetical protein
VVYSHNLSIYYIIGSQTVYIICHTPSEVTFLYKMTTAYRYMPTANMYCREFSQVNNKSMNSDRIRICPNAR